MLTSTHQCPHRSPVAIPNPSCNPDLPRPRVALVANSQGPLRGSRQSRGPIGKQDQDPAEQRVRRYDASYD